MNIKDMIVPLVLAIATTWALNHFFFSSKSSQPQYEFSAPQSQVECQPLSKEISFQEARRSKVSQVIPVETQWGSLEFSSDGGSLVRLSFDRSVDDTIRTITTIFPPEPEDKSSYPFMVGLNSDTPFYYQLTGQREDEEKIVLTFQATSSTAAVTKAFSVHKAVHQVDLKVTVEPRGDQAVQPRIFYPSPYIPSLKDQQVTAADIMVGADVFKKEQRSSLRPDSYWVDPSLFGAENKFFVHAMVQDQDNFTQRAYFNFTGDQELQAILEGPEIEQAQSWNLSFYLGPKESTAMNQVDVRLENTLDYSGMWAPISRILLMLLNWLYDYVHNYGFAIIILTALIRLLLLPFSLRAKRGMKNQKEMQRKMQYINQKYKDDPQAKAEAQAQLFKEGGFGGLASCLPLLVQFPIFLGLSRVLSSSIDLYQAPFLWIRDLSASDPYYILPAAVVLGIMYRAVTMKDSSQRVSMVLMSIVFGGISATLPAGLVLYIAVSSLLNVT